MTSGRRTALRALVGLLLAVAMTSCGSVLDTSPSPGPSTGDGMALTDLSVIGCAGDDPRGEGELTGTWEGNDSGVYYIRQVGDCVWWFGTEVTDIAPDQSGFANVASGRISGSQVDLEWADVPLGSTVNGGGLTFIYDAARDELTLAEQRGGAQPFGGSVLTRVDPSVGPSASPSASASP